MDHEMTPEDINIAHFQHVCQTYAQAKGYKLSEYAEKILRRCITKCNGNCPCDPSRGFCPCQEHEKEVQEQGHCHCNLFLKNNENV